MLHKTKTLSAVILLVSMTYGCDNDSDTTTNDETETPPITMTPAESLGQFLAGGAADNARSLNLTAIQSELDSLAGGSRNSEPVSVMQGDTASTLLTRSQAQ